MAFDFVTHVIYNKEAYYPYDHLRQHLTPSIARLDVYDPDSGLIDKDLRLLFRIANYQEARRICLLGASPAVADYIFAACPSAQSVDSPADADFVYIDLPDSPDAHALPHDALDTAPVGENGSNLSPITFDLGRFFIILQRPKMVPQDYVINYF